VYLFQFFFRFLRATAVPAVDLFKSGLNVVVRSCLLLTGASENSD